MAKDRIEKKDVIDPGVVKGISDLNKELAESVKLMTAATNSAIELSKAFNPKSVKDVTESVSKYNEQNKRSQKIAKDGTDKLTALQKERIRVENEKRKILAKTLALEEKSTKTLIKGQERLKIARKKAREEAQKDLGVSKKRNSLFKSMTKSILAAGAATLSLRAAINVFKSSIKTIANFEEAMSKVRAVTGALPKDFKALQDNAKKLGSTTSKTATEVAGLQLEFSKLGFSTQEILAATEATIQLSIAAGSDLAESAKVAASTVRGFGLSANETQRVVDVMAKSFSSSALDLEKFKVAMAAVAPVAKANGKDIEFVTSRLSILSDAGLDASTSGTSLRNMFLELSKKGLTWEQGLEKINSSTDKNVTALDLFGKRGATAALILADNVDKANDLEKAYDGAAGSAEEMARVMEDNLIGDTKKLSSAWEGFILGLNKGEGSISNVFRGLVKWLTNVVNMFNLANKSYQELVDEARSNTLSDTIKEDANEVEFLASKLSETMSETEAWNRSIQLVIKSLSNLKGSNEEINESIDSRIFALNALIKTNEEAAVKEEETTTLTKDELKKREDAARNYSVNLMKLTEKRYEELDEMNTEFRDSQIEKEIEDSDLEIERWMEQQNALTEVEIEELNKRAEASIASDEAKKESTRSYIAFATQQAQQLSDSIFAFQAQEIANDQALAIEKAKAKGASEEEIAKIEKKYAEKRKKLAITQAVINTALAVTNALNTQPFFPLGLIMAVLAGAAGAIEIATISNARFAKGTKDSGAQGQVAWVGEQGTERINYADGTSAMTPNSATLTYLPPHSEVVPNHRLQQDLADMQMIGGMKRNARQEEERRRRQEHKDMIKAIKNRDETNINITEGGFYVTAKRGADRVRYIDNKYRQKK